MEKISAVIVAKDEAVNLPRCLKSLAWADEIVVVESGSVDDTVNICRQHGCRVIHRNWMGYGPTKRFAVEQASHDLIFSVDADEEVSPALAKRIEGVRKSGFLSDGYRIRRLSWYQGRLIRHGGWGDDYVLRLFDRRKGNFNFKLVHESVEVSGRVAALEEPLFHHPYKNFSAHLTKIDHYTTLAAETARTEGRRATPFHAVAHGVIRFLQMYLGKLGFLDGTEGFLLCVVSGWYVFLKYIKIWEKGRSL